MIKQFVDENTRTYPPRARSDFGLGGLFVAGALLSRRCVWGKVFYQILIQQHQHGSLFGGPDNVLELSFLGLWLFFKFAETSGTDSRKLSRKLLLTA